MEIDNMLHLLGISHQNWRRGWTNSNSETFCLLTSDIWMYLKSSVVKKLFKWKILITLGDYGSFCCTHVGRNRDSRMEIQWDIKNKNTSYFCVTFLHIYLHLVLQKVESCHVVAFDSQYYFCSCLYVFDSESQIIMQNNSTHGRHHYILKSC